MTWEGDERTVVIERTFDMIISVIERTYDAHMFPEQAFHVKDHWIGPGNLALTQSQSAPYCHTRKRDFAS